MHRAASADSRASRSTLSSPSRGRRATGSSTRGRTRKIRLVGRCGRSRFRDALRGRRRWRERWRPARIRRSERPIRDLRRQSLRGSRRRDPRRARARSERPDEAVEGSSRTSDAPGTPPSVRVRWAALLALLTWRTRRVWRARSRTPSGVWCVTDDQALAERFEAERARLRSPTSRACPTSGSCLPRPERSDRSSRCRVADTRHRHAPHLQQPSSAIGERPWCSRPPRGGGYRLGGRWDGMRLRPSVGVRPSSPPRPA